MQPHRRVTSPRLALARSFVVTLLVALTLLGVRAAVSGAAVSLPPGGLTKLSAAGAERLADEAALDSIHRRRYGRLLGARPR